MVSTSRINGNPESSTEWAIAAAASGQSLAT